jgi:dTDP-D-glucose 4,6-dehydratase
MKKILVTGGAGFIGSAVCRYLVKEKQCSVLNLDKLTYAGVPASLQEIEESPLYRFAKADVCDKQAVSALFADFQPDAVMHLAAESHVDRSIDGPAEFIETNVVGTYTTICTVLDELKPRASGSYKDLITFVTDRPGHDMRYAIDATKLEAELGWKAQENFDTGIRRTIQWYLDNAWWWAPLRASRYSGERLGKA